MSPVGVAVAPPRMRRLGATLVLALGVVVAVLALAAAALAAPTFPKLTGRVVDEAQILSPAAEDKLTAELKALEDQTGRQVVVATVPSLQGYEIEDFGYQLGRTWGIGDKDRDDGVVFLIAPSERKVRIEVGYGLEPVLTDALSNVILQRAVLPAFKAGDLEGGVTAGTEAIIAQLGLPEDQARALAAQAKAQQAAGGRSVEVSGPGAIALVIAAIVIWALLVRLFGFWWWLPLLLNSGGSRGRDSWGGGGGWGGGGFSGGGGSFGGGGSSGSW